METLKQKTIKADFSAIGFNSDPLDFISAGLKYFVGLGLSFKEKECPFSSRAMFKLGCYV